MIARFAEPRRKLDDLSIYRAGTLHAALHAVQVGGYSKSCSSEADKHLVIRIVITQMRGMFSDSGAVEKANARPTLATGV